MFLAAIWRQIWTFFFVFMHNIHTGKAFISSALFMFVSFFSMCLLFSKGWKTSKRKKRNKTHTQAPTSYTVGFHCSCCCCCCCGLTAHVDFHSSSIWWCHWDRFSVKFLWPNEVICVYGSYAFSWHFERLLFCHVSLSVESEWCKRDETNTYNI